MTYNLLLQNNTSRRIYLRNMLQQTPAPKHSLLPFLLRLSEKTSGFFYASKL